jgi:hypothetical protein
MATAEMSAIVLRVVDEIWNNGDLDLADDWFAPGYVNHGGLITDLVRGPEAVKFAVAFFRRAFPRLRITVDDLTGAGDRLTFRWRAQSRAGGTGQLTPQAGPERSMSGMMSVRIRAGKIAESWIVWNAEDELRRLGMTPTSSDSRAGKAVA